MACTQTQIGVIVLVLVQRALGGSSDISLAGCSHLCFPDSKDTKTKCRRHVGANYSAKGFLKSKKPRSFRKFRLVMPFK